MKKYFNYLYFRCAMIFLAGFTSSCTSLQKSEGAADSNRQIKNQQISIPSMGMVFVFEWESDENSSFGEVQAQQFFSRLLERYDNTFSDWMEDSELRRLENKGLATASAIKASTLLVEGLFLAKLGFQESGGLFDITIGSVIWKERSRAVGMTSLEINVEESKFRFGVDPVRLSFGGIAKGMLTGEIAEIFLKNNIQSFYASAGGGNEVYAGRYLAKLELNKFKSKVTSESVLFVSHSNSHFKGKQHIFDPRDPQRTFSKETHLACMESDPMRFKTIGALADVFSTALVIEKLKIMPKYSCIENFSLRSLSP